MRGIFYQEALDTFSIELESLDIYVFHFSCKMITVKGELCRSKRKKEKISDQSFLNQNVFHFHSHIIDPALMVLQQYQQQPDASFGLARPR